MAFTKVICRARQRQAVSLKAAETRTRGLQDSSLGKTCHRYKDTKDQENKQLFTQIESRKMGSTALIFANKLLSI